MNVPRIVPRSEWLARRTRLLEQEKELTRHRGRLAAARREMPIVEIDKRLDQFINTYNFLDLTPLGRGADDLVPYPMAWLRYHDNYDAAEGQQCSHH
jgi:predicted dithiol-disulfide oxidoreductase (DUF899 family)